MNNEKSLNLYDDDAAMAFIQKALPEALCNYFEQDDLQYFLDLLYEMDEQGVIDEEELVRKMLAEAAKDGFSKFDAANMEALLMAENEYCKSLGLFE